MWESLKVIVLWVDALASVLFAVFSAAIISGWYHQTATCAPINCDADAFFVSYVTKAYIFISLLGILARKPAQIGWEWTLTIFTILPLMVVILYTFWYWREMTGFQWLAWGDIFWTELIDIVGVINIGLLLTMRSYFGVVDTPPHH